ncbi:hypothetical protein LZ30DRAFT_458655 [Colletotrichum cereale]|nr:hypothetical protein LZ30DRAFT_458655 [Colletotrichum cereale]
MRFQVILAVISTYVAYAMAGACEDCQTHCPRGSEAECNAECAPCCNNPGVKCPF